MVHHTSHGGNCCGVRHVHGFDGCSVAEFDDILRQHFGGGNGNRILEAILSDRQVVTPPPANNRNFHESVVAAGGWPPILASRGFVLVEDWINSNTNRRCYRFIKLAGRYNDRTTMDSIRQSPLPFNWDTEPMTIREPAPVEVIRIPPAIHIGDTVRLTNDTEAPPSIGDVTDVRENGMLSVRWRDNGREVRIPREDVVKVNVESHAVDRTRSVEIVRIDAAGNRTVSGPFLAQPHDTGVRSDGETVIVNSSWFHLDTGEYGRRSRRRFIRNVGDTHENPLTVEQVNTPRVPAPAERREVLVEYFAHFRSGRRTGPYETMEALRAANPRVLSFVTRRILSDGTVETSGPARIPA